MSKYKKILVLDSTITVTDDDFISLTDMLKSKDGNFFISDWLRNRNTLEYLGIWEKIHNPDFNYGEFAAIKSQSGLNSYKISVKEWSERTKAIGIKAKTGRYGGTYAHKDIAFEFGMWISAEFKIYLVKEFQRLKEAENDRLSIEWDVKRLLSKTNYHLQTDAVQKHIIPQKNYQKDKQWLVYAEEADLLNVALFGCTAKDWREANPEQAKKGMNIRDVASINELTVLSNIESMNAILIKQGVSKQQRFTQLNEIAKYQLEVLNKKQADKKQLPK
jgi:hypothetical protein